MFCLFAVVISGFCSVSTHHFNCLTILASQKAGTQLLSRYNTRCFTHALTSHTHLAYSLTVDSLTDISISTDSLIGDIHTHTHTHIYIYIYIYIFQTAGWWNPQTLTGARADWAHRDHDPDPEAEGLKTRFTNPPTAPRMRRSSRKTPQPW